jgi:creatinine amidohydrolase/Fe(II)-dependent formamide hydrolase-like protein
VLLSGGGGLFWSAEMRAARVVASAVLRRVMKSVARLGGRSAMMCGGDGGNVVVRKMMVRK